MRYLTNAEKQLGKPNLVHLWRNAEVAQDGDTQTQHILLRSEALWK